MTNHITPLTAYNSDAYIDIDRTAALALRTPLITQLLTVPPANRTAWLTSLAAGITDGLGPSADRDTDAYALGQRIALLLIEEGHA